jgi:hypothetical protein
MSVFSYSYWQQTATRVSLASDLPPSFEVEVIGEGLMGVATTEALAPYRFNRPT